MEEKKLYGSLKRLQNFPLDLTCVYETYAEAEAYCKKKNSKAYLGQVIAVWNDKDEIKNSIYFVCKDSNDNLILKRPFNETELNNGIAALKGEIKEKYDLAILLVSHDLSVAHKSIAWSSCFPAELASSSTYRAKLIIFS